MRKGLRLAILAVALLGAGAANAQQQSTSIQLQTRLGGVVTTEQDKKSDALSGLGAD